VRNENFEDESFLPNDSLSLLLGFDVLKDYRKSWGLLTKVSDHSTGSANNLLSGAVLVEFGQTTPLTNILSGIDHDQMDTALLAKRLDKTFVLLMITIIG
jgi:hypothetical protein